MPVPLPRRARGSSKAAYSYNRQLDIVRSLYGSPGPGTLVTRTTGGTFHRVRRQRRAVGGGSNVARFQITAIANDTLTCKQIAADGSLATATTTIARPPLLRASGNTSSYSYPDANTRRDLSFTTGNVDELVTPAYAVGSEILAAELSGTSVMGIVWQDINGDGREWKFPKRIVKACVLEGGQLVTKNMVVYGSVTF